MTLFLYIRVFNAFMLLILGSGMIGTAFGLLVFGPPRRARVEDRHLPLLVIGTLFFGCLGLGQAQHLLETLEGVPCISSR